MNCSKCGTQLEAGARFCGVCGQPLDPTRASSAGGQPVRPTEKVVRNEAFARTMVAPAPSVAELQQARENTPAPTPAAAPVSYAAAPVAARVSAAAPVAPANTGAMAAGGAAAAALTPASVVAAAAAGKADLVGTTLNNRYLIKARIGEGGFGTVYKGEQIAMGRECAIKVLHGRMARDQQVVARFKREAQAASVLRAAHTVAVYDFDQTQDGVLYLAMELLHGRSLHEEMAKGPMPPLRAAHVLDGICDSLGEAHAQNIVHRDIKPENIFIETRGTDTDFAKVLDFGIAKITGGGEGQAALTAAGQTLGTVEYMSPEQLMGQPLDGRSDLYALGNLAYELLTGHLPWPALKTPGELITAHLKNIPQPPSKVHPELRIPPLVDDIILKLLQKQRDNRYRDAAELQADLRKVPAAVDELLNAPAQIVIPVQNPDEVDPDGPTRRDLQPLKPRGKGPEETKTPVAPMQAAPSEPARSNLYVIAGVVILLAAIAAATLLLFGGKAGAAEPPSPARMMPANCEALLALDFKQLRQAAPASAVDPAIELLKPRLATLGADPEKAGRFALCVDADAAPPRMAEKVKGNRRELQDVPMGGAVAVMELPVDKKKFDAAVAKQLGKNEKFAQVTYKGVKLKRSPSGEYAILPEDRLALASGAPLQGALDLRQGAGGAPLVDGEPSALLEKVGVRGGEGRSAFGWARLDDKVRRQMDRAMPGTAGVEELAGSLDVGAAGADMKVVGRCGSPAGATQAVEAVKAALVRAKKDKIVILLGLVPLADAIKAAANGSELDLSLHLSAAEWTDVATRLSGVVISAAQTMLPPPEPMAVPKGKKQAKK